MTLSTCNRHQELPACSICVVVLLAVMWFRADPVHAADAVTRAEIESAWKARQNAVSSFRLEWTHENFQSKEWRRIREGRPRGRRGAPVDPSKITDIEYQQEFELLVDGERTRLKKTGQMRRGWGTNELKPLNELTVFDGQGFTRLQDSWDHAEEKFPQVDLLTPNQDLDLMELWPAMFCYRLGDSTFRDLFGMDQYKLTDDRAMIDDVECIVLANEMQAVWVDPAADMVVRAWVAYAPDRRSIVEQLKIAYEKDATGILKPTSWRAVSETPDGVLKSVNSGTVDVAIINSPSTDADFTIKIPENAVVVDQRDPKNPRDPERSVISVQKADGTRTEIGTTRTYKDALNQAGAEDESASRFGWLQILGFILATALVLLAAVWYVRKRRT